MPCREGKSLEKLYPFSMPGIKFRLAIEEPKCLMIRVKNKSLKLKVVTPLI